MKIFPLNVMIEIGVCYSYPNVASEAWLILLQKAEGFGVWSMCMLTSSSPAESHTEKLQR